MKLIKILAFVLGLALLGTPMIGIVVQNIAPTLATAPNSPIYFSVEPTPNSPMTNLNSSTSPDGFQHSLEPGGYATTPVTDYFNVTINLRNATVANVESETIVGPPSQGVNATGIWAVEVHFDFSQIAHASDGARVCEPIGFTNMLGTANGVLTQNTTDKIAYGISAGFYDSNGNPVSSPGLATQYMVAAASTMGPWNGTVGTVAVIEFEIMGAPDGNAPLSQPDFIAPMTLSYTELDATIPPAGSIIYPILLTVPCYNINGSLHIVATSGVTYDSAALGIISPLYKYSAALGYTGIVNATVSNAASVPMAFNVELIFNNTGVVGPNYIPTGYIVGVTTIQNLAALTQENVLIYGYTSVIGLYSYNNVSIYTEPVLGEENNVGNNGPIQLLTQNWKAGYYIMITIPGDFHASRKADLADLTLLAKCYNDAIGNPKYNPNCDVKDAGTDGLTDLSLLASHYNYPNGTDTGWTTGTY